MSSEIDTFSYGDFIPAKKSKTSQKFDENQGSFVRVNPKSSKNAKVSALQVNFSSNRENVQKANVQKFPIKNENFLVLKKSKVPIKRAKLISEIDLFPDERENLEKASPVKSVEKPDTASSELNGKEEKAESIPNDKTSTSSNLLLETEDVPLSEFLSLGSKSFSSEKFPTSLSFMRSNFRTLFSVQGVHEKVENSPEKSIDESENKLLEAEPAPKVEEQELVSEKTEPEQVAKEEEKKSDSEPPLPKKRKFFFPFKSKKREKSFIREDENLQLSESVISEEKENLQLPESAPLEKNGNLQASENTASSEKNENLQIPENAPFEKNENLQSPENASSEKSENLQLSESASSSVDDENASSPIILDEKTEFVSEKPEIASKTESFNVPEPVEENHLSEKDEFLEPLSPAESVPLPEKTESLASLLNEDEKLEIKVEKIASEGKNEPSALKEELSDKEAALANPDFFSPNEVDFVDEDFSGTDFDFALEEPSFFVPRRKDEIAKFLENDKKDLKIEKSAIKLLKKYKKRDEKEEERVSKIREPIGIKLVVIISFLLVVAVGSVTYAVSYFVTQDTRSNAEENNLAINSRTTIDTENRINSAVSSVTMFLDLISNAGSEDNERRAIEKLFFDRNKDVVAVYYSRNVNSVLFTSEAFLVSHEIEKELVLSYMQQESESEEKAKNGSFEILNATPFFNVPMISLFCPTASDTGEGYVAFLYSTSEIGESFASGSMNQSFMVNNDGIVLVHSDLEKMNSGADESESKIVQEMLGSKSSNGQIPYTDENGDEYIGAFRRLGIGNGGVITIVKTSVILEGIKRITIRNIYIMFAVIALAILIIYFFAKSLSKPLKQLTDVVNEVNKGNFNTELFDELKLNRRDEIGVLERSTKNEREILNMVSRLTNKGVTKAVITKKIDFEPHLKDITVFFSDIRGFTAISDGFKKRFGEHSAAEIIGFLNDYMSRMVTCINKTGGIVDKFEGDAIMAAWGVLRNDNLEWEKLPETSVTRILKEEVHGEYVKADALSAITCCVAMRYSLMKYNKDAAAFTERHKSDPMAKYKPHIRIGAGLNSGRATVGFMGSFDKMEFTSIGDSVNFASRAEASNKPCGTDILITQDTYDILKHDYIRCEENNFIIKPANIRNEIIVEKIPVEFEVKGKGKQHFYGVVNMPNLDIEEFFKSEDENFELDSDCELAVGPAGPKNLKELRALLGIETPDFEKVNLDAEENKIQVAAP